jgi:cytochrome c oxidase subunit 2
MLTNFPLTPPQASSYAGEYDAIFYALLILTVIFTVIVGVGVMYFVVKYKQGTDADRSRPVYEDLRLELSWTFIPMILALVMFYFGTSLFIKMRIPPADAQEIFVIGKQWMWHVQHSNGVRENNTLHVPAGKPVKLTMISQDVIHAFFIPAFRAQMHVVPGRYTTMWFTPTTPGKYHLFCSMYCGTQHSEMGGTVVVMEPREWANWIANGGQSQPPLSLEQAGQKQFNQLQCGNCHGIADGPRGPGLQNLFGSKRKLADGRTVIADEAYVRESILRPHNKVTAGYEVTMPVYDGQINEEDVVKLLSYIKVFGKPTAAPSASPTSADAAVLNQTGGSMTPYAANAIQYQESLQRRMDATPTTRRGNPAVNAIAAQELANP